MHDPCFKVPGLCCLLWQLYELTQGGQLEPLGSPVRSVIWLALIVICSSIEPAVASGYTVPHGHLLGLHAYTRKRQHIGQDSALLYDKSLLRRFQKVESNVNV